MATSRSFPPSYESFTPLVPVSAGARLRCKHQVVAALPRDYSCLSWSRLRPLSASTAAARTPVGSRPRTSACSPRPRESPLPASSPSPAVARANHVAHAESPGPQTTLGRSRVSSSQQSRGLPSHSMRTSPPGGTAVRWTRK